MKDILIFVYNAQSDFLNKYIDVVHKIVSPSTYSCNLCSLTHGNFVEKKKWKNYRENTNLELMFMYKDEFLKTYSNLTIEKLAFPVIFRKKDSEVIEVVFDSGVVSSLSSVEELIDLLRQYEED